MLTGEMLTFTYAYNQTQLIPDTINRRIHTLSLASVKSRLVLPFWYRLTWVVPEKEPLNGCVCVCGVGICPGEHMSVNRPGLPPTRAPNAGGVVKIGDFRQITGYVSKTVKDRHA